MVNYSIWLNKSVLAAASRVFLRVHRLRQIIGCLLGARVTNPLDHMSVACQAQSQCSSRTQLCRTGKHRHTVHPHVSSHRAFDFFFYSCLKIVSVDDRLEYVSGCELS